MFGNSKFLFTTDGFGFYKSVVPRVFGPLPIFSQVIKKIRKNRVVKVNEKLIMGNQRELETALAQSPDSSKINTSFIERLNLTIRQGNSYLRRRSSGYARDKNCLKEHIYLQQCYYNFIRPHYSLRYLGNQTTPAMAAKIVSRRIDFRTVFSAGPYFFIINYLCTRREIWHLNKKSKSISNIFAKEIELLPKQCYGNQKFELAA